MKPFNGLPVVCVFGLMNVELKSLPKVPDFETAEFDCRCYLTDENLQQILVEDRPHVFVSFGKVEDYPNLMASPFEVRKRWLNFENFDDPAGVGRGAYHCFISNIVNERKDVPLVTVFTPTYNIGDRIQKVYASLEAQTYKDWEWVIVDDSEDDGETFEALTALASKDVRVVPFKPHRHSGVIGSLKRQACGLARGEFLLELDHDDEFTPDAIAHVLAGFKQYPEAGFVYTDCAEVTMDMQPLRYGEGWGHGYGSYRTEVYKGRELLVTNASNINPKTIRHIVAAPNHIRAWRRSCYFEIGGHNTDLHVADDYELMVRTFLNTRMVRVPHLCYIQYMDKKSDSNTQRVRNKDIQRLVRYISTSYDKAIHTRFLELGVKDFVWDEKAGRSDMRRKNPPKEPHCTLLAG